MTILKNAFLLLLTITFLACHSKMQVAPVSNLDQLKERITYLVQDPSLYNANVGVYIESLESGELIYNRNEHKLFISASNMKIYTTSVALLNFGPDFRYKTSFLTNANITDNTLTGDLIIHGSGDPTITGRFHDGDVRNLMRSWADSLIAAGITQINGNIVGDASYFQNPPLGAGWQWDDEPFWYSAQICALSVNDNCIDVTVTPGERAGDKPIVLLEPTDTFFNIENRAQTAEPDSLNSLFITRPRLENTLIIKNDIPLNHDRYSESISVEDPAKFFVHIFGEILTEKGIKILGNLITNYDANAIEYQTYHTVFTHQSPPLYEIVDIVNKRSQNLYAEQLLLTLAAEYGASASASEGTKVVTNKLATMGISEDEFRMKDGSGLARKNLISPFSTAALLKYMANHRYGSYFFDSLPIGGVDGTLKNRMKGSSAVGKVYAKTGYVGYARNLSGYVDSRDGERFIFSVLVNNYTIPTPAINILQDRICTALAEFKR